MSNKARPKSRRNHKVHPHTQGRTHDNVMATKIDQLHSDLAEFEEFRNSTLKAIRKDISKGMDAKKLREKYAAILQGRLITDALTTENEGQAAMIAKDVLDRVEGKATEKKEVTHKFSEMKEEELDAILQSELQELEDMEQRFEN